MTTSNYITFILLGVIGLVFLIDFILNSRKKPLEKSVEKFVEKEKSVGKSNFKWLNWILDRKKNLTLSILLICILKVLVHFFIYRNVEKKEYYNRAWHHLEYNSYDNYWKVSGIKFSNHLDELFWVTSLWMFIPITIVFLVVVWFFNDKIKAR